MNNEQAQGIGYQIDDQMYDEEGLAQLKREPIRPPRHVGCGAAHGLLLKPWWPTLLERSPTSSPASPGLPSRRRRMRQLAMPASSHRFAPVFPRAAGCLGKARSWYETGKLA